ncbi:MAG: hypothetical protein OQL28_02725 [Sedimenticola sp.]|nr:hypothetical protein [Sedimenticola sp.]
MKLQLLIVFGSAWLVAGCVTTDDPREGGFLGGVHGLTSGAYERRTQEREANLEKMREMQNELNNESKQLARQKQQRQQVLQEEKGKLAVLSSDVDALEFKLVALNKEEKVSRQRVTELDQRISRLKNQLASHASALDALERDGIGSADTLEGAGTGGLTADRRQQLEAQRQALQKEYETLLELTLMLSQ